MATLENPLPLRATPAIIGRQDLPMNCRWSLAPAQPELAAQIAAGLKVSPLLAQCLLNRGLNPGPDVTKFLEPRLKQLADPFLLPNMAQAVERLFLARERNEPLVIFGDYDVDGVTATALLLDVLKALGWRVDCYLPHRLEEGYGLSQEAITNCLKKHPATLLLAVDCGSTAVRVIEQLKSEGIDSLILDHHQISSPPPPALALVNPHLQMPSASCFTELCSVGLAFKLAHALVKRGRQTGINSTLEFDLRPLLDLVALGTIADLVPLRGENRILVAAGLQRLSGTPRLGLKALSKIAGISERLGVHEVAFQLAPRLNAAGRLENAVHALELLLTPDPARAEALAELLDTQNRRRQQMERSIAEQVIGAVRARFNPETDYVIVEGQPLWHVGVVGIVASRVLKEFYRPTVIIGGDGHEWRGSGRSIEGFDLAAALRSCADLLTRHGGHAMAAGLSLPAPNVDALRARLNELARASLSKEALRPALQIDAEVPLGQLTTATVSELTKLAPFGMGNPTVQFVSRGLSHERPPQRIGKKQQHLKMWVKDTARPGESAENDAAFLEAVLWNCEQDPSAEGRFDLAYSPEINTYNGRRSVQLKVLDWRAAE